MDEKKIDAEGKAIMGNPETPIPSAGILCTREDCLVRKAQHPLRLVGKWCSICGSQIGMVFAKRVEPE